MIRRVHADYIIVFISDHDPHTVDSSASVGVHLADADAVQPLVLVGEGRDIVRFDLHRPRRGIDGVTLRRGDFPHYHGLRFER